MLRIAFSERGGRHALPFMFLLVCLGGALALGSIPLSAQTVQGQLLNKETLAPIEGALVVLLDAEDEEHDGYLTNAAGRFILRAPGPGRYTVKADRIGFGTVSSDPFSLTGNQIFGLRLEMGETAIQLAELRVEGEQRCVVRPEEGMDLARVWDEAKKALTVQEWTEREGLYRFQVVNYEREMDADARRIEGETRKVTNGVSRSPIRSLPARDLMENGFVQGTEDGGWTYYGPDAAVMLSDEFLDSHCFHLKAGAADSESLGLAFEPVRGGDLPDIAGTLWLDRETATLQYLEFRYTWARYAEAQGVAQGRVDFEGLPNGSWIVRKWWIRMPRLAQNLRMAQEGRSGVYVDGIREAGAEVAQISTLDRRRIAQTERGFVSGLVWDSTSYRPLAGANVYLSGTSYSGETDDQGRFLLEGIPQGVFTATFTHPRLDTLGVFATGVEVEVLPGEIIDVLLGVPALGNILVEACREEERREGAPVAVVTGIVRDRGSGEPIPRATVTLSWQEVGGVAGHLEPRNRWIEVPTNGDGRYSTCKVTPDETIVVQGSFLDRKSDTVHVRIPEDSYTVVDLEIDLPNGIFRSGPGRVTTGGGVGIQGVQGFILEPDSGEPVRDAEVRIRQIPGTETIVGITNNRGFFRLQTRVPGDYSLSATALGFAGVSHEAVVVHPGKLTVLEVKMAPAALELPPLVVTAEARTYHLEMQGFYDRQTKGLDTGVFMSPELIDERRPVRVTDLFYGLMGTRVVETVMGSRGVYFRMGERVSSGGVGVCWPMVYLDRQLLRTGGLGAGEAAALDELIDVFDVAAIEVYRSAAEIPPEFNGPNAGCGVIVLWTKRGGSGGESNARP